MSDWQVNLECTEGGSRKFWRARTEGATLFVNFGRIGTTGQTQVKDFPSDDAADKELQSLERSKRKKGYEDAGAAGASGGGDEDEPGELPTDAVAGQAFRPVTQTSLGPVPRTEFRFQGKARPLGILLQRRPSQCKMLALSPTTHTSRSLVPQTLLKALPVTADTSAAIVGFYLNFHTLAKSSLVGIFRR